MDGRGSKLNFCRPAASPWRSPGLQPHTGFKTTALPINNEADNGLTNVSGSIAMARTGNPHTATAQFFINTADNTALNHTAKTAQGWGYTVFGKVTLGMDVVKAIEATPTGQSGPFADVPANDVVITRMELVKPGKIARKQTSRPAGTTVK